MRINVNDGPHAWRYVAYLNGVQIRNAVEADEEQGYIIAVEIVDGKEVEVRKPGVVRIELPLKGVSA